MSTGPDTTGHRVGRAAREERVGAAGSCSIVDRSAHLDYGRAHRLDALDDLTHDRLIHAQLNQGLREVGDGRRVGILRDGETGVRRAHAATVVGFRPTETDREERALVLFDFSWVWGPPSDELATLFRTIGSDRFVYGTMWPLRLTQGARANLALLPQELVGQPLAVP